MNGSVCLRHRCMIYAYTIGRNNELSHNKIDRLYRYISSAHISIFHFFVFINAPSFFGSFQSRKKNCNSFVRSTFLTARCFTFNGKRVVKQTEFSFFLVCSMACIWIEVPRTIFFSRLTQLVATEPHADFYYSLFCQTINLYPFCMHPSHSDERNQCKEWTKQMQEYVFQIIKYYVYLSHAANVWLCVVHVYLRRTSCLFMRSSKNADLCVYCVCVCGVQCVACSCNVQ